MTQSRQRLLIDTDIYCKLGIAGLLSDAMFVLGTSIDSCERLPALPFMLRRGRLPRRFGDDACESLALVAEQMPVVAHPGESWLAPLISVAAIDPGEAQLLASAAERGLLVLTGDKRGLHGVKNISRIANALEGRVVVLEAMLAELCLQKGEREIRDRICPFVEIDSVIESCFSNLDTSPLIGILSYFQNTSAILKPLNLWRPPSLGAT